MQDIFNKISKTATNAANLASNKAGELTEIARIKSKINGVKGTLDTARKELGLVCEELYADGKIEEPSIRELCERIELLKDSIADYEAQIEVVKNEYQEKRAKAEEETL